MTGFELNYSLATPFLPPLHRFARQIVAREIARLGRKANLLDVGGRKSHYTIGLNADVTISDLPRTSPLQKAMHLGVTDEMHDQIVRRRSNVSHVVYDDMTASAFSDASYDLVMAVEVLEHVLDDVSFVREVHRVLVPGGVFVMTTPNGDHIANTNPDHKRHYRRSELEALLGKHFPKVQVWYGIAGGWSHSFGLRSWSWHKPARTVLSMLGNVVNTWQSRPARLSESAAGTHNLFAVARK